MIDDYSRDLLRSGIIEFKAGNRDAARRYLDRALYMSGDHDVLAEGWYWMSQTTDDPVEKRRALENCLANDLRHARARRALAILDGKLKPEDVVDPDSLASKAKEGGEPAAQQADSQRFMCPKCGGRMTYSPDGQSLVCEYCRRHEGIGAQSEAGPARQRGQQGLAERVRGEIDKDFLIAMATARGHNKPLAEQVFRCQGCSAEFILPPGQISITCPYCESPHVISFEKSADLIAPDGIIPHAFDVAHAIAMLTAWLQKKSQRPKSVGVHGSARDPSQSTADRARLGTGKLTPPTVPAAPPPRALYLPMWTFELGGALDYVAEKVEEEESALGRRAARVVRVADTYPVMMRPLPIPASRKLSAPFIKLMNTYDLPVIRPYKPEYLANWPAELYDIPMGEASLDARSQGLAILKRDMAIRLAPLRIVSVSSANLTVESFRLNLLPVWMTEVAPPPEARGAGGPPHLVLINGQTGDIYGDLAARPSHSGNPLTWLADLLGD
ncbi:MAG TPA: hypothetical protein VMJ64_02845 [Anaerolineales bacterium]|nr:hypothetical protein [Anaerolineales bacterium]